MAQARPALLLLVTLATAGAHDIPGAAARDDKWEEGAICTAGDATKEQPDGEWGHGHALYHDWYSRLRDRRGVSCCNGDADHGDCRPAQARLEADGTWRVWLGSAWVAVPPQAILDARLNRDPLHAHVCAHRTTNYIYCFLPGASGS